MAAPSANPPKNTAKTTEAAESVLPKMRWSWRAKAVS